jgi:hypothetical protein
MLWSINYFLELSGIKKNKKLINIFIKKNNYLNYLESKINNL